MVMKRNVMGKNLLQTIRRSIGRYIAIIAIIALGSAMFVGLVTTKSDMIATGREYTRDQNMFHLRMLNTYGWTQDEVDRIGKLPSVSGVEGSVTLDVIADFNGTGEDKVYRLHTIPDQIDQVYLLGGRMPQKENECLAEGFHADDSVLGMQFRITEDNDPDTLDSLKVDTFTVVGYVSTPLYMDMTRGTTTIGSGALTGFFYVPKSALDVDYYSAVHVVLDTDYESYTPELDRFMEDAANELEPQVMQIVNDRYHTLKSDAQEEYDEGYREYAQGVADYEQAKEDLATALKELEDGQAEFESAVLELEDGEQKLEEARSELKEKKAELIKAQRELNKHKEQTEQQLDNAYHELMSNYSVALDGQSQLQEGLAQLDAGITQLKTGIDQTTAGITQLEESIQALNGAISNLEDQIAAEKAAATVNTERLNGLKAQLADQKGTLSACIQQKADLETALAGYQTQLQGLEGQRGTLQTQKDAADTAVAQIEAGFQELEKQRNDANQQLNAAQAQIDKGTRQLKEAEKQLASEAEKLEEGKAELEEARQTLEEGWAEYYENKDTADRELADAEQELNDAKVQLEDAAEAISQMTSPELFILDRNTNPGYVAVNNNSDIVEGVSRVFPIFFLFIAALVCITTLTKMVDEERTQIGILKALGYGSAAIVRKYLLYCGSAAVLGCSLGVSLGSVIFPLILWRAYSIILCVRPDVVLQLNVPLCLAVLLAYTAVSMAVTWMCCHRELRAVPAELIRPKAPAAGKKIFLEYLPFWNRIGFLNKVMFRNVFRYRQRLLMMLVGIGGCTALLLTGFGIRDSIGDIVDYQFAEITTYDMEVYFSEGQNREQQEEFRREMQEYTDQILFYHRASVELSHQNRAKELSLMAIGEDASPYLNLHSGNRQLEMPQSGEILLSIGAAEAMEVQVGDRVTLRDADMRSLEVTVSGIFDNHVNNYLIIDPETILRQWGSEPEQQMALVNVGTDTDVHEAGARISEMEAVMSVAISQDIGQQVGGMLEALNLIVITVVVCAGLLVIIVLYNLTNINISERIREIATIKVLGFQPREAAAYVFKENLLLSAMGAAVGLGGGVLLLEFVMSQIKIDMVWFQSRLIWQSYLVSFVLTMGFACLVNFLLRFKLEKINMAEALKSVE